MVKKLKIRKKKIGSPQKSSTAASLSTTAGSTAGPLTEKPRLPSAVEATQKDILDPDYWRKLIPFLAIRRPTSDRAGAVVPVAARQVAESSHHPPTDFAKHRQALVEEGYCSIDERDVAGVGGAAPRRVLDQDLVKRLSLAASVLEHHGWPTTFLALFDETWRLAEQCQQIMSQMGAVDNKFCLDIVGFNVVDGVGFSPHRDRQPDDWQPKGHMSVDPKTTFDANGFARYLTCWVALTDAHPGNSCLHYVSAKADPGYFEGDPCGDECEELGEKPSGNEETKISRDDPMVRCFFGEQRKQAFQSIRACPVRQGGLVVHTHRVIHWGNQGDREQRDKDGKNILPTERAKFIARHFSLRTTQESPTVEERGAASIEELLSSAPPNPNRVAISFAFSNNGSTSFEPPYLPTKHLPFPAFELRAALCCAQVLNYSTLTLGDPRGWRTLAGRHLKKNHLPKLFSVFQKHEKTFASHYRHEIATKFVAVSLGPSSEERASTTKKSTRGHITKNAPSEDTPGTSAAPGVDELSLSASTSKTSDTLSVPDPVVNTPGPGVLATGSGTDSDSDLEDNALEAMLDAERSNNAVLFHDDFDVLAASGALGELKKAGVGSAARSGGGAGRTRARKGAQKGTKKMGKKGILR